MSQTRQKAFRPRARLMLLLGDQLIRDVGIAMVELVKNAYDADANSCTVTLSGVESTADDATIVVEDDGQGMDLDTVLGVWLEPGTEHRRKQKQRGERTRKYGRLPLGEKGVGRFAVHKLGQRVRLVSRRSRKPEVVVEIDWRDFEAASYLEQVPISVSERKPEIFRGRRSGTRIEVSGLRDLPWTPTRIQTAHRAITSVASPFGGPGEFEPRLVLVPEPTWLRRLLKPEQVLDEAIFRFSGRIEGDQLSYDYGFTPRGSLDTVDGRRVERRKMPLQVDLKNPARGSSSRRSVRLTDHAIGPIDIDFRIFDRDPKVLRLTAADPVGVGQYLDRSGGVRIYRDGVRVYDYGEPGNDWLELGARRLKKATRRVSNNQIVGAVHLDLAASSELIEKTNREGFVENEAFEAFRYAVLIALAQAEAERNSDRTRIRAATAPSKKKPVLDDLGMLAKEIESRGLTDELGPYLRRIESQYQESLERLLSAAGAGLNLGAVLHEVERGLADLSGSLESGSDRRELIESSRDLSRTIEGLTWLTRRSGETLVSGRDLLRQALDNSAHRLAAHGIDAPTPPTSGAGAFRLRCSRRLVLSALMNLIDNSIYWLANQGADQRTLHLELTFEPDGLPGLLVADSGPGFLDPPEDLVQPFFTRKPHGMGLGLHIADEVMRTHKGQLRLLPSGRISLPKGIDGAVAILEFPHIGK